MFIKRDYFNKTIIIKGLYTALLLSACIYLSHFQIEYKLLHTLLALLALYQLLITPRVSLFYTGFFVGIFWFYWVSFSFIYYELSFLIPVVIIGFALMYGILFLLTGLLEHVLFRTLAFIALACITPFGFNWFQPQIILTHTYFEPNLLFLLALLCTTWFLIANKKLIYAMALIITFIISYQLKHQEGNLVPSQLDIAMPQMNIKQEDKWNQNNQSHIVQKNITLIEQAIEAKKDLIILPETAFPLVLNQEHMLLDMLKTYSKDITIIVGSLYQNKKQYNNSTYLFDEGNIQVAHKVVLVPFGEYIPFPKFIRDFINNVFYAGAQDYEPAKNPTDFVIANESYRNAICYEATTHTIYENLKDVRYIIATSNNAWFTPSIEPTLQKMLMTYYAKKYNVMIYHVANGSKSAIIHP